MNSASEKMLVEWLKSTQYRVFPVDESQESVAIKSSFYFGNILNVFNIGSKNIAKFLFRNHADTILLGFLNSGNCTLTIGDDKFKAMPNRFAFLLHSKESIHLDIKSASIEGTFLQCSVKEMINECSYHKIDDPDITTLLETLPGNEGLLLACIKQLIVLSNQASTSSVLRTAQSLEESIRSLLASLISSRPEPGQGFIDKPQSMHVNKAMSYFENNIKEQITLADLCRECNISARTLQIAFHNVMQRNPMQVLNEIRLTQLRKLLMSNTDVRAGCIAVGLAPSGRTANAYKKLFGELPSHTRAKRS